MNPDHFHEFIEEVAGVMGTRCTLRVVLHRESRLILQPDSFYGSIVEIDMGNLQFRVVFRLVAIDAKSMVLGSDLGEASLMILYKMVHAPVTMMHFEGFHPLGAGQQLVAQANTEQGNFSGQCRAERIEGIIHGGRISGTIRKEKPMGVKVQDFLPSGSRREYL